MGRALVEGEVQFNRCATDCSSRFHILIERDYEHDVFAWMVVVGSHEDAVDSLAQVCSNYIDEVDSESSFVLQSVEIGTASDLSAKILQYIEEVQVGSARGGGEGG